MSNQNKNVVLIIVDALRKDILGCYGNKESLTPNLDALAMEGVLYKNAFSAAPYTPASVPALLSGIYPLEYGYYTPHPKPEMMISKTLKDNDYLTVFYTTNPYASKFFGYDCGWDYFFDCSSKAQTFLNKLTHIKYLGKYFRSLYKVVSKIVAAVQYTVFKKIKMQPNISAKELNKKVFDFVRTNREKLNNNFFMTVFYLDPHYPYFDLENTSNVSNKRQLDLNQLIMKYDHNFKDMTVKEQDKKDIEKLYKTKVAYVDKHIGELIKYFNQ